jgi:hypothetical protein
MRRVVSLSAVHELIQAEYVGTVQVYQDMLRKEQEAIERKAQKVIDDRCTILM